MAVGLLAYAWATVCAAALLAPCDAYAPHGQAGHRHARSSRAARAQRASPHASLPSYGSSQLAAASEMASHSTGVLLAAEGSSDVFKLVLTGGVGIMAFSMLNLVLVGAVARGNWQVFEDEAATFYSDQPGMDELRSGLLSNDDLLEQNDDDDDDDEAATSEPES